MTSEFETFWKQYPRRVGKLAAQKAYRKARQRASAQELLDGIERYRKSKPSYADWCHPATFLNQGRWMDEIDAPHGHDRYVWVCPHEQKCNGRHQCHVKQQIEAHKKGAA